MKKLISWFSGLLNKRWVLVIFVVILTFGLFGLYKYFHPDIYRIPSNPDNLKEIHFFALGDQGSGSLEQRAVADAMDKLARKNKNLDFVILLGDNFYIDKKLTLNSPEWNTMFEEVYSGAYLSAIPFYAILGNHDADLSSNPTTHTEIEYSQKGLGSNRWRMPAHYFHKDFGKVNGHPLLRIVFLDTNVSSEEMAIQADYVRKQFIDNPIRPIWKIVAGHHTIRTGGKHHDEDQLQKSLLPVLQKAKVDIYLSGHDHNQQLIAMDGEPTYVINGAGGKSLYSKKIDSDNQLFFNAAYGFVSLKANADLFEIDFYDDHAKKITAHVLDRNCVDSRVQCIKAIQ